MPMKGKAYRKRKAVTVGYIVIALLSFFIAMDFFFRFNILAGLGALIAVLIIVFMPFVHFTRKIHPGPFFGGDSLKIDLNRTDKDSFGKTYFKVSKNSINGGQTNIYHISCQNKTDRPINFIPRIYIYSTKQGNAKVSFWNDEKGFIECNSVNVFSFSGFVGIGGGDALIAPCPEVEKQVVSVNPGEDYSTEIMVHMGLSKISHDVCFGLDEPGLYTAEQVAFLMQCRKLGKRLKELRDTQNLKLSKAAKIIGLKESILLSWERGESQPDEESLLKIAEFYQVNHEDLQPQP